MLLAQELLPENLFGQGDSEMKRTIAKAWVGCAETKLNPDTKPPCSQQKNLINTIPTSQAATPSEMPKEDTR